MKFLSSLIVLVGLAFTGYSQGLIDLTLRYNIGQSRYEVYARPTFSQANFNWGSAQVSVAAPASIANSPFVVTSVAGGGWDDVSQVYAPAVASTLDFHGIGSQGKKIDLVTNQETLLFYFTLPQGNCVPGLRLYVNGSDPNSAGAGMQGGDFTNVVYTTSTNQQQTNLYQANYANTGTVCTVCNLVAPTLSK
ncbi:hypothetical protein [Spirosoma sp.]|uniref:hypothetical protein n=1 Tax=Spirosoma sp. TaxID=1899569 RepID=UPI002609350F|nr:hypothetical protein [Spirosoma sp.]MCX6218559.1 hypothetical protein [Spirosoma sp.]